MSLLRSWFSGGAVAENEPERRPIVLPSKPEPAPLSVEAPSAEYSLLAQQIGFHPEELSRLEFELFLQRQGVQVYPLESVEAYMDALMLKLEADEPDPEDEWRWFWRPLRDADSSFIARQAYVHGEFQGGFNFDGALYRRLVPMPVLETVNRLREAFHAETNLDSGPAFLVTDYDTETPDPFLAVSVNGLDLYVIERWDEPGFRS